MSKKKIGALLGLVALLICANAYAALTRLTGIALINSVINSTTIGVTTPSTGRFSTVQIGSSTILTGTQGNSGVVQQSGTNSGVTGDLLCNDASGNATTACVITRTATNTSICTTGGSTYDVCDNTMTWNVAFPSNAYTITGCTPFTPNDPRAQILAVVGTPTASNFTLRIVTEGSNPITFAKIVCTGRL